uniref:Uncharacterized protein n=1 Tax=Rhizophora mucronata TaxID=61149 RepID=A0A2P2PYB0_RHIMU
MSSFKTVLIFKKAPSFRENGSVLFALCDGIGVICDL